MNTYNDTGDFLPSYFFPLLFFMLGILAISLLISTYFNIRDNKRAYEEELERDFDLQEIDKMDGWEFETCFAIMLRQLGYVDADVTKGSGDQGIDVLVTINNKLVGFQCKRYSKPVGNKAVQEAHAGKSYYGLDKVCVATNSYFTKSAIELAEVTSVTLVDRDELHEMLKNSKTYPKIK